MTTTSPAFAPHHQLSSSLRTAALAAVMGPLRISEARALQGWITLVANGWSVVDAFDEQGRRFLVARSAPITRGTELRLSDREAEVALLAALGHANKSIAYELGISVHSVGTYLIRVKNKLGLKSRLDLVRLLAGIGAQQ